MIEYYINLYSVSVLSVSIFINYRFFVYYRD